MTFFRGVVVSLVALPFCAGAASAESAKAYADRLCPIDRNTADDVRGDAIARFGTPTKEHKTKDGYYLYFTKGIDHPLTVIVKQKAGTAVAICTASF